MCAQIFADYHQLRGDNITPTSWLHASVCFKARGLDRVEKYFNIFVDIYFSTND